MFGLLYCIYILTSLVLGVNAFWDSPELLHCVYWPDGTVLFELYKGWKVGAFNKNSKILHDASLSTQCGQENIVVNNGTSPFQVEIIPENVSFLLAFWREVKQVIITIISWQHQQKTLYFATNEFVRHANIQRCLSLIRYMQGFILDLPAGSNYFS